MDGIPPNFLIEAESLLQSGNARDSAVLCARGIAKYPMYKTAYIVLIRALNDLGDTTQIKEVYDEAPNFVKFSQTVQYMMNNLGSVTTIQSDKAIDKQEKEIITETDEVLADSEIETKISESNVELESEITEALKNDNINPDLIENLTKPKNSEGENNDSELSSSELKETLTLAKIYEQQDAYQQALDIYLDLQSVSDDKNIYLDKIEELKAIIESETD